MNYGQVLKKIELLAGKYKGKLYYGTGTLNDLNSSDDRDYPLCWLVQPLNNSFSIQGNNNLIQTHSITIQFIDSKSLTTKRSTIDKTYSDLEGIAVAFIGKLIYDFDTEGTDTLSITSMNQIHLEMDSVHVGWQINFGISNAYNLDLCCSSFED